MRRTEAASDRERRSSDSRRERDRRGATTSDRDERPGAALQRRLGNRGVQALLRRRAGDLRVSDPDDPAEREADRLADAVLDSPGQETGGDQRESRPGIASEDQQGLPAISGMSDVEPEGALSRSATTSGTPVDGEAAERVGALAGGGRPLSASVRSEFEPRFGRDLGGVRVHTGRQAHEAARAVDARAFALGRDVAFAAGNYRPESGPGRRLLAHELAHVVQGAGDGAGKGFGAGEGAGSGAGVVRRKVQPGSRQLPEPGDVEELLPDDPVAQIRRVLVQVARRLAGETGRGREVTAMEVVGDVREQRQQQREATEEEADAQGLDSVGLAEEVARDIAVETMKGRATGFAGNTAQQGMTVAGRIDEQRRIRDALGRIQPLLASAPVSLRDGVARARQTLAVLQREGLNVRGLSLTYEEETGESLMAAIRRVFGPDVVDSLVIVAYFSPTYSTDYPRGFLENIGWSVALEQLRTRLEAVVGSSRFEIRDDPTPAEWETAAVEEARSEFEPNVAYSGEFQHVNPKALEPMPVLTSGGIRQRAFGDLVRHLDDLHDRDVAEAKGESEMPEGGQGRVERARERAEQQAELEALAAEARQTAIDWAAEKIADADDEEERTRFEEYKAMLERDDFSIVTAVEQTHWRVGHEDGEVYDLFPISPGINVDRPSGHIIGGSDAGIFDEESQSEAAEAIFDDADAQDRATDMMELFFQNEGRGDSINTWDRANVTVGPGIAAMGVMQRMYWQLHQRDPAAYHELLGRYGIGVHERNGQYVLSVVDPESDERLFGEAAQRYIAADPTLLAAIRKAGRDPRMKGQMLKTKGAYTLEYAITDFELTVPAGQMDGDESGSIRFGRILDALDDEDRRTAVEATIADIRHASGNANSLQGRLSTAYAAYTDEHDLDPTSPESWDEERRSAIADELADIVIRTMKGRSSRLGPFREKWPDIFDGG